MDLNTLENNILMQDETSNLRESKAAALDASVDVMLPVTCRKQTLSSDITKTSSIIKSFNHHNTNKIESHDTSLFTSSNYCPIQSSEISSGEEDLSVRAPLKKRKSISNTGKTTNGTKFRPYQAEKWQERFDELINFRKDTDHCLVPHTYPTNPALARWVKRQRYQYGLFQQGKQSSMTSERIEILENIGFVWDSHEAAWQERLKELLDFKKKHGTCAVPSKFPSNPQLSRWVKCQRRQYRLYWEGRPSNMTIERITALKNHGFEWRLRKSKSSEKAFTEEANVLSGLLPSSAILDADFLCNNNDRVPSSILNNGGILSDAEEEDDDNSGMIVDEYTRQDIPLLPRKIVDNDIHQPIIASNNKFLLTDTDYGIFMEILSDLSSGSSDDEKSEYISQRGEAPTFI